MPGLPANRSGQAGRGRQRAAHRDQMGPDGLASPGGEAMSLTDNDRWLLSYYRSSEINGALFFGRIARTVRAGKLQAQVTHHFNDEASHAAYWTDCINDLGASPDKLRESYQ